MTHTRFTAPLLVATLALAACSSDVPSADASATPSASASTVPTAAPSGSDDATDGPSTAATIQVVNLSTPGTAGPASVASLEVVTPTELVAALIAVDGATGAVSWWNGIEWLSYDVDAALDHQGWATDGHGGLIVQDEDGRIFHLEPFTDEPTLVLEPPPVESNTFINLVGGGVLDGTSCAFVEQATYESPETAKGDISCVDVKGRADRLIFANTSGWESGTGQMSFVENTAVMTAHAECFSFVITRVRGSADAETVVEGEDCESAISGVGHSFSGPAIGAVVESIQPDFPATYLTRSLGEFTATSVTSMPTHTEGWYRLTSQGDATLISSYGVAVIRQGANWTRLELDVPGQVAFADDLALG